MIDIEKILNDEIKTLESKLFKLENKLSTYPKGTIFVRKMRNKYFAYRKYREGNKIISEYLGPSDKESVIEAELKFFEARKIKNQIRKVKEDLEYYAKLLKISKKSREPSLKEKVFRFINNQIKITFKLTKTMKDLVKKAENADEQNDYGLYMNVVDAIDSQAKKEVNNHIMTEGQWNKLLLRYCL